MIKNIINGFRIILWIYNFLIGLAIAIQLFSTAVNKSEGQLNLTLYNLITFISIIISLLIFIYFHLLKFNELFTNLNIIKNLIIFILINILIILFGYGSYLGNLFVQANSQTTGQLIIASSDIPITGLEILNFSSNFIILFYNFILLVYSLFVYYKIFI